jgi:hypothetical protein
MSFIAPRNAALASVIVLAGIAGLIGLLAPRQPLPFTQLRPPVARDVAPAAATPSPLRTSRGGTRPPAPLPQPADVVAAYYAVLDAHRFETAWRTLAPPVRSRFGSFETWRAGYASTVSSRPGRIAVSRDGSRATVQLVLDATDRTPCGLVHRQFAVRWALAASDGRWQAQSLTAAPRGAARAACPAR